MRCDASISGVLSAVCVSDTRTSVGYGGSRQNMGRMLNHWLVKTCGEQILLCDTLVERGRVTLRDSVGDENSARGMNLIRHRRRGRIA